MTFKTLLTWDFHLSSRLRLSEARGARHRMMAFLAHTGDSWFWLAGLAILWLFGDKEWHTKSAMLGVSLVLLAVLVLAIKFTVRRRRPEGDWGAIYRSTDPHSFPSGHAARAAMFALLAWELGPPWFGWLLVIWAPLVSLARVIMGVHYLSDVLAGFVIGLLVGALALSIQPNLIQLLPFLF